MMEMMGRMTHGSQLQRISAGGRVLASCGQIALIITLATRSIKVATVTGCSNFRGMATFNYSSFVGQLQPPEPGTHESFHTGI